jgi:ABC-2 type transport system ATP-binding protein
MTFEATPQLEAVARLNRGYRQVEALGSKLHVFTDETDRAQVVKTLETNLGDIKPEQVQVSEPELEDVFVALLLRQATGQDVPAWPATPWQASNSGLAIEARELIRDFGRFRAVDRVSFQVKPGEIFGLLGANGAGKTTVIKMLNGILSPSGGEGWVAGADMRKAGGAIKERIGYMSQAFSLYLDLTVEENIRLFAGIYGLDRRATSERLDWIVSMGGLKGHESSLTGRLPMGVRQRLALGCALVHRPRVLFLDEPTSGVDPIGRRHFWDILSRLAREEGVAILITTHYMSEAEHCDHLALMYAGRIVAEGSPAAMKVQVEHEAGRLLEVATDQPGAALQELMQAGFTGAALFGTKIHLLSQNPSHDEVRLREALSSTAVHVQAIAVRPLSLEDVFVHRVMALERQERQATTGVAA